MEVNVFHYDAFSTVPGKGNPAGVVLDADHLTEAEMQKTAYEVGFNETAFIVGSDTADIRIRYFTPGHEMNLCGHATIASIYCLAERGLLPADDSFTIETKAGILPIRVADEGGRRFVSMTQASPSFVDYRGDVGALAAALGLAADEIDDSMPIVYGSTGSWTLLVPIRELAAFSRMNPDNTLFPGLLRELPKSSVHPFCFQALNCDSQVHSRHFSSPHSGTQEDPVTGTASGVIGCYYASYIESKADDFRFNMEQGYEIGREGTVDVFVTRKDGELSVSIAGTAVYVKDMVITV